VRTWPRGGLGEGCGDAVGSCSLLPKGGGGGGRAAECGDGGGLREREDCVPGEERGFRVPRVHVPLELVGLWSSWARAG
jgi:hypothetical protein